jgi:hypothetical protein
MRSGGHVTMIVRLCLPAVVAVALSAALGPAYAEQTAGSVTFALTRVGPAPDRTFDVELQCDGEAVAEAQLSVPEVPTQTRAHDVAGKVCVVAHRTDQIAGRVDEIAYTARDTEGVIARRTLYSRDGMGVSSDFVVPQGDTRIELEVESLASDDVGMPVRVMTFNIWRSGKLDGAPGGEQSLEELIGFLRSEDPDILFMVETYGSGPRITDGLNAALPAGRRYTGVPITREPGQAPDEDNLWLFTRYAVEKVYERRGDGDLTSFNFGGARLRLPNGQRVHVFPTWLHHTDGAWNLTNQSALESTLGLSRTYTDQQILDTDKRRRNGMATTLLQARLPEYLSTDPAYADAPVIVAGDFNTLSHQDWTARFANAPGHGGLVLDWTATKQFTEAGFTDTYRWANPHAGRYPGRTWSPIVGYGYAPGRIDYILTRGEEIRVLSSYTRARRLPQHRGSPIDELYPFYSDHAAVVTDLLLRGRGPGPTRELVTDAPEPPEAGWPDPPAGDPVPPAELVATATSENPNGGEAFRAVDGDLRTHWHSRYQPAPPDPLPHDITIDMQRQRDLTAVRYQPRIVGNLNGTLLRALVQVSDDGNAWRDVTAVEWERTTLPKDVDLRGLSARYLRFHVDLGIGGFSSAAEITPYEASQQ